MDRTPDNMGRPVPANYGNDEPELHDEPTEKTCPECGIKLDAELFPELRACFDHEDDREVLRDTAVQYHYGLELRDKELRKLTDRVKELEVAVKECVGALGSFMLLPGYSTTRTGMSTILHYLEETLARDIWKVEPSAWAKEQMKKGDK